jgi:fucose 4-O-acetylase-like acetyltransferase
MTAQVNAHRIKWADTLKGIGIVLVFFGHSTLTDNQVYKYIYSFHMPLFFFISGMFFKGSDKYDGIGKFILRKVNTRIVPYIAFGLLTYVIWLFQMYMYKHGPYHGAQSVPDNLLNPLLGMVCGNAGSSGELLPHNALLWFLACLFVTDIIFFSINRIINTTHSLLLILSLLSLVGYIDSLYLSIRLPFSIDVALNAVVFYGIGYISKNYLIDHNANIGIVIICLLLGFGVGYLNDAVDMYKMHYGNILLFYASSLSNIYAYIYIAKHIPSTRLITYLGQNSIVFFLLQVPAFIAAKGLVYLIFRIKVLNLEPNFAYASGFVLLSLLLLYPVSYIINSKIPIITGR